MKTGILIKFMLFF